MTSDPIRQAGSLTLREAYAEHYDRSELSQQTVVKYRHMLNAWERHTTNPSVESIDDEVMEGFRESCLASELAPATINGHWGDIRAVLNRLAPKAKRNPRGLGIIAEVPWMRRVKQARKRPKRIPLEALSKVYLACKHARYPTRTGLPPADWWRLLIVLGYATGLRRRDLLSIRWDEIDWQAKALAIDPGKTGKADWFPLTDWALAHLERAQRPGETVFDSPSYKRGGRYSENWKVPFAHCDVPYFTLHDIRRTAASEVDRIDRGLGKVFLQHRARDVSEAFYLCADDELREAVDKMRVPVGFKAAPRMADRAEQQKAKEAEKVHLQTSDFDTVIGTDPKFWKFTDVGFEYRSRHYRMVGLKKDMLRKFVETGGPVKNSELREIITNRKWRDPEHQTAVEVSRLRNRLRKLFGLGTGWDPLPCLAYGVEGCWQIHLPAWLDRESKTSKRNNEAA